jgi:hypothetical protein
VNLYLQSGISETFSRWQTKTEKTKARIFGSKGDPVEGLSPASPVYCSNGIFSFYLLPLNRVFEVVAEDLPSVGIEKITSTLP